MPENCIVAAEITLKCLHVAYLLLLPVLMDFYFRFAYAVKRSHISASPIDFMFGSMVGFSGSADRMTLFRVGPNSVSMWKKTMREE